MREELRRDVVCLPVLKVNSLGQKTGKETHALKSKSQTGNHLPVLKNLQLLYIYTQLNVCTWMYLRKKV